MSVGSGVVRRGGRRSVCVCVCDDECVCMCVIYYAWVMNGIDVIDGWGFGVDGCYFCN